MRSEQYRRVFGLMRNDSSSSEDDEPGSIYDGYESDEGRRGRSRSVQHLYPHQHAKRMSIYNNTSLPGSHPHSHTRASGGRLNARRFFHSNAIWDPVLKTVVPKEGIIDGTGGTDPFDLERKGRSVARTSHGNADLDADSMPVSIE